MSDRLVEVTEALVAAVRDVLSEHRVRADEFFPAVDFLIDLTQKGELPLLTDALGFTTVVDDNTNDFESEGGTASNVLGPYYRPGAPEIEVGGSITPDGEPGAPLLVRGTVRSTDGAPAGGALIDVWQCNANGEYEHQVTGKADYYLRRRLRAAADGTYSFRTITPVPYEIPKSGPVGALLAMVGWHAFRPAHIHFKVDADGYQPLVTQMYFEGGEYLHDDRVGAAKDSLAMPTRSEGGVDTVDFDVALVPAER